MVNIATINGKTAHTNWDFKLEVTEGTPSIPNNTSPVTVKAYIGRNGTASYMHGANISCVVSVTGCSNQTISYKNSNRVDIAVGQWLHIGTVTFSAVPHNSDGSKTVTVGATFTNNISPKSGSASGSFKLTTIARQSSFGTITGNTLGSNITVNITRNSSSYTHQLKYKLGNSSWYDLGTGIGTSKTFAPTINLCSQLPNNTSGTLQLLLKTFNGSTQIGSDVYKNITVNVPSTVKPSCTMTLEDITGVDDTYGSPVQSLSKIKVTVNPTTAYGSAIKTYKIEVDGKTFNTSPATTDVLINSGASEVTVTVTDNRNRSGSTSYTMNVQAYTKPTISKLIAQRCNSDGTLNKRGDYIKVTFSASVSSMDSKNTATYALNYKKTKDSNFTSLPLSALANTFTVDNYSYIFSASRNNSYDIQIYITDRHNLSKPYTKDTSAPSGFSILSWRGFKNSSGNVEDGLGIGKIPEKANALQVGWEAEFDKEVITKGNQYCFSTPGTAGSAGYIKMAQLTHKKENADTPITFVFTRRLCPHPMTVHIQFRTDSTTVDPELKTISYEGNNYGAFLVHEDVSVWGLYVQKVSAYDTITMQTWFSSATTTDRLTVEFTGELVSSVPEGLDGFYRATPAMLNSLLDYIYPVNSIYMSYSHNDPNTMFGGTWVRIENRFLWGCDADGNIGGTGGAKTHTLTDNEMPNHKHIGLYYRSNSTEVGLGGGSATYKLGFTTAGGNASADLETGSSGGGAAHNNMPPFIQVSIWRRTA